MRRIAAVLSAMTLASFAAFAEEKPLKYPRTATEKVVEELHGIEIQDPYRWLEKDVREAKDVAEWVEAQNKVTDAYLEGIPSRKKIKARLTELWNYTRYSIPFKGGERTFFFKNDGLQNQAVLFVQDKLDGEPRVLLDPNKLSKDGTVALGGTSASDDGKYLAYALADAGSDWNTWHVLDIDTGKKLDDELKWTKFTSIAWTADGKGFFYSRFDEPKEGQKFKGLNFNQKVYFHKVGTPQADDELIHKTPDHPKWGFTPAVTEDGRYLVLTVWQGTDERYRVTYFDLKAKKRAPIDLIAHFENDYTVVGSEGTTLFFKTNLDAPNGRVIAIDLDKPEKKHWKEIIPQAKESVQGVSVVGDSFIVEYLKDAKSQVRMFALDGKPIRDLELPGICSASGFGGRRKVGGGKRKNNETFYSVSSFTSPSSIYRLDVKTGKASLFRRPEVKFKPDGYAIEQSFVSSKDGTKVPIFLAYKKGMKRDGGNPTLLYGYGGFNISLTPDFSVSRLAWMEMGGVLAVANLRGGGEYGEDWHQGGTKLKKQNVFDDFIAVAEWLVKEKVTSSKKLAIQGGSNGGLLVGACMTQRPELFGACLPAVGVMDMLRFHKFTAGRYWVDDYGSPDEEKDFKALLAYSPYHNLKAGAKYPPTLVTTADTDDRVVPGHSFKYIARLQACQAGPAPVLIRIETRAGHGAGKPTTKMIEEVADQWAFLMKNLGMEDK